MFKNICYVAMLPLFLYQSLYASSAEDYIKACTANQKNRMGPELCECMANKGKDLSEEEFDFFYAIAAKDQGKVNKGHATLDSTQKMNVMQLSMMGPSKCANELAAQQNSSDSQNSSNDAASTSVDAVEESYGDAY